jgi:hypothetical protein
MKTTRLISILMLFATLAFAGCKPETSPVNPDPTPEQGTDDEGNSDENGGDQGDDNGDEGNGGDNGNGDGNGDGNGNEDDNSWIDNPQPMPEATYALNDRLLVTSLVTYADGHRNDYMTFYDELTGLAVYLDIYTSESNTILETGRYLLADSYDNAVYYQWSYFVPYVNADLVRFTDGWLEVIADAEHSSGYPYHKIRAYFDMESGESVSIEFEGTIVIKDSI